MKPIDGMGGNGVKLDLVSRGNFATERLPAVTIEIEEFVFVAWVDAVGIVAGQVMHFRDAGGVPEINDELSGESPVAEGVPVKDILGTCAFADGIDAFSPDDVSPVVFKYPFREFCHFRVVE